MATATESQMVCHECDLLVGVPSLEIGQKAFCPRCNYLLAANRPRALDMVFAFSISALLDRADTDGRGHASSHLDLGPGVARHPLVRREDAHEVERVAGGHPLRRAVALALAPQPA